jgi:hypothetical protein
MSQTIKTLVLLFLQGLPESKHEQFNQAYELYKKSPDKNLSVERNLNRIGFTDSGLQNLLYDLQKMHGITDTDIANPVEVIKIDSNTAAETIVIDAEEVTPGVLGSTFNGNVDEENLKVDESKPLREEFPFLNDKDCPEVFYIVVGKKISTYKAWQEAQQKLAAIEAKEVEATPEEIAELAKTAEASFRENQELHDELNHYVQTGEILGKHPLFRESVAKREVDAMTLEQLSKFRNSSAKFFSVQKKKLIEFKDNAEKLEEINSNIEDRKFKLSLVNAKLGIEDAGK